MHSAPLAIVKRGSVLLLLALAGPVVAQEQKWGDLEGTFKVDGQVPAPGAVAVNVDKAFCGKFDLVDESLVIGRRDGIANIVIFLTPAEDAAPPVHEEVAKALKEPVLLDNNQCRFDPHIAIVSPGQTLTLGNSDQVGHNVNAGTLVNPQFNILIPAGAKVPKTFDKPEPLPASVTCNIHPWMKGWVFVPPTPYAATTDDRGRFEIENLPVGKWQFRVWHENKGYVTNVSIGGKAVQWKKGVVEIEIQEGKNDLGDVTIAAANL